MDTATRARLQPLGFRFHGLGIPLLDTAARRTPACLQHAAQLLGLRAHD